MEKGKAGPEHRSQCGESLYGGERFLKKGGTAEAVQTKRTGVGLSMKRGA